MIGFLIGVMIAAAVLWKSNCQLTPLTSNLTDRSWETLSRSNMVATVVRIIGITLFIISTTTLIVEFVIMKLL